MSNCLKCHELGKRVAGARCLACHKEIQTRVSSGVGLHGATKTKACSTCHSDHRGRGFKLIDWGPGQKSFDHGRTGYWLRGKHKKIKCEACHQVRPWLTGDILTLLKRTGKPSSFLGLRTPCQGCHFDEHREQLSLKCGQCHGERAFTPTTNFNHNKDTTYRLRGLHSRVRCQSCHPTINDPDAAAAKRAILPALTAERFVRYSGISKACVDCHKDPHQGTFGRRCNSCHSEKGWKVLSTQARDTGFHNKTRYPLRGRHIGVSCRACHGPHRGQAAVFKGLRFASCLDCHLDAHMGQIAQRRLKGESCERCHNVSGFSPPHYSARDHAASSYPLKGGHRTVACNACHKQDKTLLSSLRAAQKKRMQRQGRPLTLSLTRMTMASGRCLDCHRDPHGGQFDAAVRQSGCVSCHRLSSFRDISFDHTRQSRYPLTGRHRDTPCAGCHRAESRGSMVVYKPLAANCASCHEDEHMGQFDYKKPPSQCEGCHTTESFTAVVFDHQDLAATNFPLRGQHQDVDCVACHVQQSVQGRTTQRYRGTPQQCSRCHEDAHQGEYSNEKLGDLLPVAAVPTPAHETSCVLCHEESGFGVLRFSSHGKTGFALRGGHARVACAACHERGIRQPISQQCATCHAGPHAGDLGQRCERCHTAVSWQSEFGLVRHAETNFPLTGQHAALPCNECHLARTEGFSRTTSTCVGCHATDVLRTVGTVTDHEQLGLGDDCRQCHDTTRFTPARLAVHGSCFASGGPHRAVGCLECHTSLAGASFTGACATFTAACSSCHDHRCGKMRNTHNNVPGYQCADRKCYECHPFAPL